MCKTGHILSTSEDILLNDIFWNYLTILAMIKFPLVFLP